MTPPLKKFQNNLPPTPTIQDIPEIRPVFQIPNYHYFILNRAFDMLQMEIPLNELLVSLENNIDVLDEGAKAEILLTRFKFQKFKRALEAKGGDAVDEF